MQQAAVQAIHIWWEVLFPSLMPFLILSELMIGFGIVHFIGTLLDPLMRPLFRVPGIGGYVMTVGFASGYPVAAKLSAQLAQTGQLTRVEAERLSAFATTADPMFINSAIAIGFLKQPQLAPLLLIAHFASAFLVGLLFRFYGPVSILAPKESRGFILYRAIQAMHHARLQDGRRLATLLSDAIERAITLVLLIGGFVVGFAVLLACFPLAHLNWIYALPFIGSLLEVTLGVKSIVDLSGYLSLSSQLALISFALAWGGLSVHLQIIGISSLAKLRYFPFLLARLLHATIAMGMVYLWVVEFGN